MLLQGEAVAVEKCFATWQFLANFPILFCSVMEVGHG